MLNFQKLLDWRFWLSLKPSALSEKSVRFLLIGSIVILGIAVFFWILAYFKRKNPPLAKLFKKLRKLFFTMGLVGLILLFLSYEQIYLLGSHFWYLLWLIGFLVWLGFIARYMIFQMPKEKEEIEKKKRFLKYLPR